MIKKLLSLIILVSAAYGVMVFTIPATASKIDTLIGVPGLSEKVRNLKNTFDASITQVPSLNEFKSGALDIKNTVIDSVDTTKDTIDGIRGGAQKVEETYNGAKETYDDIKDTFDDAKDMLDGASQKVEEIGGVIDSVNELTGSGS